MSHPSDDMLRIIERHFAQTADETGCHAPSRAVTQALREVPRDRFVPVTRRGEAWDDTPLPIGHGQTISQPFIVALMTELLDPQPGQRVLEVGSGCGYQVAVLSRIVAAVFGIEIVPELAEQAAATLKNLGYHNVEIRAGDGHAGWPGQAPFDGILVTAAGSGVPAALREQLRVGGRLVLPVEAPGGWQQDLVVVERQGINDFSERKVLGVRFVPLRGSV